MKIGLQHRIIYTYKYSYCVIRIYRANCNDKPVLNVNIRTIHFYCSQLNFQSVVSYGFLCVTKQKQLNDSSIVRLSACIRMSVKHHSHQRLRRRHCALCRSNESRLPIDFVQEYTLPLPFTRRSTFPTLSHGV